MISCHHVLAFLFIVDLRKRNNPRRLKGEEAGWNIEQKRFSWKTGAFRLPRERASKYAYRDRLERGCKHNV